ncbi:MAG: hypothetical protein JW951_06680 [Lentisphaerae bacterium]|nr:hypothetical protein [Lentisphaerota bacterium]
MTARDCVRRAVLFEGPERVPYALPEPWGTDFHMVHVGPDPDWTPRFDTPLKREDEWGCVWEKLPGDKTMGQVTTHPLTDYAQLDDFRFPDYGIPERYAGTRARVADNTDDKFVLAHFPLSLIHRLEYLRGHEGAWTDAYVHPGELGRLLDRMADVAVQAIDRLGDIGVDGVFSCDDWGLQDRLMVQPDTFREFWKPRYRRVYRHAHEKGLLTFLHSCGYIIDILPDLKEAELDVIQMDQQQNMGLERLDAAAGGSLCFWCPVDIQNTMIRGSVADVEAYARRLIDTFGKYQGGFIAKWYPDPDAVRHAPEKIEAMAAAFIEYGGAFYARP